MHSFVKIGSDSDGLAECPLGYMSSFLLVVIIVVVLYRTQIPWDPIIGSGYNLPVSDCAHARSQAHGQITIKRLARPPSVPLQESQCYTLKGDWLKLAFCYTAARSEILLGV